ncbi:MAG: SgcJ/EcaC family oxidoreductase [Gemmatimonadaceae bacterium]
MFTRSRLLASLVLIVGALVAGCGHAMRLDTRPDEEAIRQNNRRWVEAIAAKDVTTIMSFYADDAMLMPPNGPAARGKVAIRDAWTAMVNLPGLNLVFEPTEVNVDDHGDGAYETGVYRMTIMGAQGRIEDDGKYVTVWRKNKGQWKAVADISNSNRPVMPPEGA